jgi:O-antigen/teichoic acid export membrane protein
MESLKKRIVKNSFWSFSSSIINRIGALVFTIILTRFLMPEGFGVYSIVLSTAMIFYTFTDVGINQAATRYLAYALENEKDKVSAYYSYLLRLKFFLSITVAFLLFLLAYPITFYFYKNPVLFVPLLVAAFYILILAFETFYMSLFYSVEKAEFVAIRYFLEEVLRITFALLVFAFVASTAYRVVGVFATYVVISLFLLLFNVYFLKKLLPKLNSGGGGEIDKKKVSRFVGLLTIATISGVFFSYIDSIMLGFYLLPEYVGYYRAAYSLVFGIAGFFGFPSVVLLPYFTKLKGDQTSSIFKEAFRFLAVLSVPCIFGLVVLGRYFVVLFFGYPFLPASLPLYFLSPLIFPIVSVSLFLSLFSAKENPGIFAKLILVTSVLNVVLNFVLINMFLNFSDVVNSFFVTGYSSSEWAIAGAALATTLSWFFYLFAFKFISKRKLGLSVSFMPLVRPLVAGVVMVIVLLFSLSLIDNMGVFWGVFEILLGMFVYFLCIVLLKGVTMKDLNLLKVLVKNEK